MNTNRNRNECAAARRGLLGDGAGPHPVTPAWERIARHLEICMDCRAYRDEIQGWRRVGRRLATHVEAPPDVRRRLFRTLAMARIPPLTEGSGGEWSTLRFAIVLALVLAVGTAAMLGYIRATGPGSGPPATSMLAEDHWRELHRAVVESHDPDTVQTWLAGRLQIPVRVMQFDDATLEGARLCFLRGRIGAVIRYRVADEPVSYFVMPAAGGDMEDRKALEDEAEQGYQVVTWRDRGLTHALVGALSRERLLGMAEVCRHQLNHNDRPAPGSREARG